jgi:hypothetical protein
MKHLKTLFRPAEHGSLQVAVLAILLLMTGCERLLSPQTGDQDATLGLYYVVVQVPLLGVQIKVDPAKPSATSDQPLDVFVSCSGKNLPADCDQNVPNWTFRSAVDFVRVQFADPSRPTTTATVLVDVEKYLKAYGNDRTAIGEHWFQVSVFPSSIPKDMKLGGKRDFTVTLRKGEDLPLRQEQAPADPRLTAPERMGFPILGQASDAIDSGQLIYAGPLANLVQADIVGPGRSKFTLLSPSTPYIFQSGESSVKFTIRFQTDLLDFAGYDATLIFGTDNGEVITIPLHGYRN